MNQLVQLVEGGYVAQAVIGSALVATACYLAVKGQPVPDWLLTSMATVLGVFFASSVQRVNGSSAPSDKPTTTA